MRYRDGGDDNAPTETRPSQRPAAPAPSSFRVVVDDGPDQGSTLVTHGDSASRLFIGSSRACDLWLHDRHVSRRHAALESIPDGLRLVDLESTNGTYVNGLRVNDVILRGGEAVQIGSTALHAEMAQPAEPAALTTAGRFGRMIGTSLVMRRLYGVCERLAASDVPVLLEGETGTGKELLAESLHESGPRAGGPFVVFDCAASPANLIESQLFGHERGAFTHAVASRKGVFELADGGTLLIDEIGELDLALQPKLLRALERSEVQPVGGNKWIKVDVRILAATRRDLEREVQEGRFREDLFYRLAVGRIELPPLRARAGDMALLARSFWRKLGGQGELPDPLLATLCSYRWPGNVRELRNAIARRIALGESVDVGRGGPRDEPEPPGAPPAQGVMPDSFMGEVLSRDLAFPRARDEVLEEFERRYVDRVLAQHHGNVGRAAAASGIARRYFYTIRSRIGR